MGEETASPMAVFNSKLLDASGQPNLITGSPQRQKLIWTLVNNQKNEDLVVTPFGSGKVDQNQYHFRFDFVPGALTDAPTLQGWDTYILKDDKHGIKTLFIALSGSALTIKPGAPYTTTLTYADAVQEDSNRSKVAVSLTTGGQVTLGGRPIPDTPIGPFHLTLVRANTPTLSAPPLAADFVGRRTVLNDGRTSNSFTFALTNMTQADIPLTPDVAFAVWFDAAPNESTEGYQWALAKAQDLASAEVHFHPPPGWTHTNPVTKSKEATVSPQWKFNVSNPLVLKPQDPDPVLFKFCGIKTALAPGVTRMYLRFENLPGFSPGVLIAELEKTPLLYGPTHGQGLYLSAGKPQDNTLPSLNYDSGLYVQQFGAAPAATFQGAQGLRILSPGAGESWSISTEAATASAPGRLVFRESSTNKTPVTIQSDGISLLSSKGKSWDIYSEGETPTGPGKLVFRESSTNKTPVTIQSDGVEVGGFGTHNDQYIAVRAAGGSKYAVGIKLQAFTDRDGFTIAYDDKKAALEISRQWATDPIPALDIKADTGKLTVYNDLIVEGDGKVGIGTPKPGSQLHVKSKDGIRLSLEGNGGGQLFISNSKGDKSVQLVAIGHDETSGTYESADSLYLGGWASPHPQLPKMILNAKEVDIQATTTTLGGDVSAGTVNAAGLVSSGALKISGKANKDGVKPVLEFGYDISGKEVSAGKLGYQIWSDGLDIVGAGNPGKSRQVHVYDDLYVHGNIWQFIPYYNSWMYLWPTGTSSGAWYNKPSDQRLKSDIRPVPAALDKLRRLCGVSFRWNEDALQRFTRDIETSMSAGPSATERENREVWRAERDRRRRQLDTTEVGVIAQEVEAVLPEAVTTGEDGYKSVGYHQLIALLIEAVKEQDLALTAQAALAARQQTEIERLQQALLTAEPRPAR